MYRSRLSGVGAPPASRPDGPRGALNTRPRTTYTALTDVFSPAPELLAVAPIARAARKAQVVDEHAHRAQCLYCRRETIGANFQNYQDRNWDPDSVMSQ